MAQVLRQLERPNHPDLLVGTDTLDDAGVFRLTDEIALVLTTDFFPPLVDDPYEFGRIAAANALSDVYAMGGEPLTAMNLVGFPDEELGFEILGEILKGGGERVKESGAVVVGGHSVRDAEIKFGLAVTGRVHPERFWTNAGARVGDKLVLTKPIGSGVLTSAAKMNKMPAADLDEAIHVMTTLNRSGRDAGVEVGVHACTDITGFGLIGHAFEIAEGSDVTVVLEASRIPLMKRTLEMAGKGALTRAWQSTRRHLGDKLALEGVEDLLANVLLDAQTSGGLLFSVAPEQCDALVAKLETAGALCHAVVGEVREPGPVRVRLV